MSFSGSTSGANVYTQGFGSRPENVEVPILSLVAPNSQNFNYPIGKRWINTATNTEYVLTSISTIGGTSTATWTLLGTNSGALNTLSDDSNTTTSPSAGNIQLAGTSDQIATTAGSSEITFSLIGPYTPATYTAHGVLLGEGTSSIVATAAGTNGQLLTGSTGADPAFSTLTSSGSTITVTGGAHTLNIDVAAPLNVAHGGTGATTLTGVLTGNGTSAVTANAVTQHGVLIGGATNAVSSLGVAATGSTLMGSTGADPAFTGSPSFSGSVTAATTLTATLGAITATNGNIVLGTAGNKLISTSVASTTTAGANSFGTVTLVGGTATISTTAITASSIVMLTRQSVGSTGAAALGALSVGTITAGTSFVINAWTTASAVALATTDVSSIGWMIIN